MQTIVDRRPVSHELPQSQTTDAVIADDSRVNAESIAWCLKAYGGFRNVTAVSSSLELLQTIRSQRPQVVLIGERLIVAGLRDVFTDLAVRLGETKIAVFADSLTDRQLDLIANNRVTGMLSRSDSVKKISEQLSQVAAGTTVLSEHLNTRLQLSRDGSFRCMASAQMQKLTDRQWDVLLNIAEGRRVSEVADALSISQKAVESHKYRIMRAIGATDRVDLCRWAIREGLIEA
ncbi:MAG: response regulator transcription factor [Planctomycetaceae bacterium]|nr:response regulator transcription factor [Planctomycetaceae bacterium]